MQMIPIVIPILSFLGVFFLALYFLRKPALLDANGNPSAGAAFKSALDAQQRLGLGKWASRYQQRLEDAGLLNSAWTGEKVLIAKELLAVVVLMVVLLTGLPWVFGIWFVVGAFFLPDLYLRDKKARRRLEIVRGLPDFLDMLTLIVEAGLDFGTAVQTILDKGKKTALTQEIELAFREIRLGVSRSVALQNMAKRLNIRDVSIFVSSVLQSEQMGTPLGAALRIQADANRERRMQRAEKLALEAPVKMIFPLVLFIFPVVFIVLIGPIVVQWIER